MKLEYLINMGLLMMGIVILNMVNYLLHQEFGKEISWIFQQLDLLISVILVEIKEQVIMKIMNLESVAKI